jgi:hypothetical protein
MLKATGDETNVSKLSKISGNSVQVQNTMLLENTISHMIFFSITFVL